MEHTVSDAGTAHWQALLEKLNLGIEEERKILRQKLAQKIDELQQFKGDIVQLRRTNLDITRAREERIGVLEKKLAHERQRALNAVARVDALEGELKSAVLRIAQLEKENARLQHEVTVHATQVNRLRMELLPGTGLSKKSRRHEKIESLESSLAETERFYKQMTQKIDSLLRN